MSFFAIGLTIELSLLAPAIALLAAVVAVGTATKLASGTVSGVASSLGPTRSLRVGLGLVPRVEYSLGIAALAASTPAVADLIPALAVGYVLVMSIVGSLLVRFADPITSQLGPLFDRLAGHDQGSGGR